MDDIYDSWHSNTLGSTQNNPNSSNSDFIRDPKFINEQMRRLTEELTRRNGFNMDSNIFSVGMEPNGDVIKIRANFNKNDIPDGWQYGVCNLVSPPRLAFYKMINGKYCVLPAEQERTADQFMRFETNDQLRDGLLAVNPHISPDQIKITPEGKLQVIGTINDLKMPAWSIVYDAEKGVIYDKNDPAGRSFEIEMVSAHDSTLNAMGGSLGEEKKDAMNALSEHKDGGVKTGFATHENSLDLFAEPLKSDEFDFYNMAYAHQNYRLNNENEPVRKDIDNQSQSLNVREEKLNIPMLKRTIWLNRFWAHACMTADNGTAYTELFQLDSYDGAFTTDNASKFNQIISVVRGNKGKPLSELVKIFFDQDVSTKNGQNSDSTLIRTAIRFLSNEEVSKCLGIELDMSVGMADEKLNNLQNENLKQEAKSTVNAAAGAVGAKPPFEMEDDDVMEKTFNPPHF